MQDLGVIGSVDRVQVRGSIQNLLREWRGNEGSVMMGWYKGYCLMKRLSSRNRFEKKRTHQCRRCMMRRWYEG
jgi:hypothetical protein